MVKKIFRYIVNNKRIMYFSCIGVLLIFCLILNYTFSLFTTGSNNISANITVGDLDYKMVINEVNIDETVGIKDKTTSIIGDRIIRSKSGALEEFNIALSSFNNFETKYEIIYNFCADSTCSAFIEKPSDINIYFSKKNPEINGTILASGVKEIGIISHNESSQDYYIQIGLNAGYGYNELILKNQITDPLGTGITGGNLQILSYVDGAEVASFPNTSNYETAVQCTLEDGSVSSVNAIFGFAANGWELNVYGVDENMTTCRVDFTSILQVTYDILKTNLKCSNLNTGLADSDAVIKYTGKCTLKNDSSITGTGNWRIIFPGGGTLTFSAKIYVDIWMVGGGGGGATYSQGQYTTAGGAGGTHKIYSRVPLDSSTSYTVTIGAGGAAGKTGGTSKLGSYTASGGASNSSSTAKCSFENKTSGCTYTDNSYSGLYGGKGGAGGCTNVAETMGLGECGKAAKGTAGGGTGADLYTTATAGATNSGSGGGGRFWSDTTGGYEYKNGAAGGSGLVAIRNSI